MRILIHDYGGYAFPFQLSRSLAKHGHEVRHIYCASLQTTPQGSQRCGDDASQHLCIVGIRLSRPLEKYSLFQRRKQELEYGRLLVEEVDLFHPEAVISGNTPLDAQKLLLSRCLKRHIKFIFWVQDLLGVGAYRILKKRIPMLGHAVGWHYVNLERALLRQSDGIALITDDFRSLMEHWGIDRDRVHVIPNWAPLDELPLQPKDNEWARQNQLQQKFCFLYSGTLGLKHNPELLVRLADHFRQEEDARIVVISQGLGADYLKKRKAELKLDNLMIMGYQPYELLPQVLATADVLVAVLEPDAGVFSVPSKVLTYLCAGRPVLLAVPSENLAARIVVENEAGLVVPPDNPEAFIAAAEALMRDSKLRETLGSNARRYAEAHFEIEKITDQFEALLIGRR